MRSLFRRTITAMARTQPGRWALSALLLAMGVVFLGASFASVGQDALGLLIGGIFFLAFGLFVLVFTILIAARTRSVKGASEARAKQLLAEGKILPIPPLPAAPKAASKDDLLRVEGYANELAAISWGDNPRVPPEQVEVVFNRAVAVTRRIAGDWSRLSEPIQVFAALPRPYCHIGAAEVMGRLSFLRGSLYAPVGLRQGLRFVTYAQLHTPLQPDSLMIQLKLLSACKAPYWQQLATQALELAQRTAPNHPRLANAVMFYHDMRGEHDEALVWADRDIASGPTPEDVFAALSRKALILDDLKRYEEALVIYDACIAQDPRDPWVWHNKSRTLTALGRYQEALACNQQALSIMDFGMAHKQREIIMAKMGSAGTTAST